MHIWTREQFDSYKGDEEYLEVRYYRPENWMEVHTVAHHYTYEDYVAFYLEFFGVDDDRTRTFA